MTFAELAKSTNGELYTWASNMNDEGPIDINLVAYTVRPKMDPNHVEVKFPTTPSVPLYLMDKVEEPAVLVNQEAKPQDEAKPQPKKAKKGTTPEGGAADTKSAAT